jgi:hypothetical protein
MEVVFHDGVGENGNAAVVGDLPHLAPEHLLGVLVEKPFPVNGAGDAVVNGIFPMNLYPCESHAKNNHQKTATRQEEILSLSLYFIVSLQHPFAFAHAKGAYSRAVLSAAPAAKGQRN